MARPNFALFMVMIVFFSFLGLIVQVVSSRNWEVLFNRIWNKICGTLDAIRLRRKQKKFVEDEENWQDEN